MSEQQTTQQEGQEQVVELTYPVQHGSEQLRQLKLSRRLRAADFRGIKVDEIMFDDMLMLISRLFAVPTSVVDQLDSADFFKCVEVVNTFLPTGQTDGSQTSGS